MVCNFVGAVPPSRSVDNPRFAARFVSLLPFHHRSDLLGGLSNENFQSPFVTCMCKQGDVVAHALLLCSLLLGQAFVMYINCSINTVLYLSCSFYCTVYISTVCVSPVCLSICLSIFLCELYPYLSIYLSIGTIIIMSFRLFIDTKI